jgi:hypothetical protein
VQKQIKFFGFICGVKPKVSKLLRRHFSGESDDKEDEAPILGPGPKKGLGGYYESRGIPTQLKYPRMVKDAREAVITAF